MMKIGELKKVFSAVRHENLRALLRYSAETFGKEDAFVIKKKTGKDVSYEHVSFADFYERVCSLGTGMMLRGAGKTRRCHRKKSGRVAGRLFRCFGRPGHLRAVG